MTHESKTVSTTDAGRFLNLVWLIAVTICCISPLEGEDWSIDTKKEWKNNTASVSGMKLTGNVVTPTGDKATLKSKMITLKEKTSLKRIEFEQWAKWENWKKTKDVIPSNLGDAPIFLSLGPNNYWMFGRHGSAKGNNKAGKKVERKGYDIPLTTTKNPHQFNAPGGKVKDMGGYHAWHSRDMTNWVHFGNVTKGFSRWATSAEYVDGVFYIYYDYPNDQDPHLYLDKNITDGKPGKNVGKVLPDPSDGSDCGVIRDRNGSFHIIFEDWTPINASNHSWDSPLAGHAVSKNGISNFKILDRPAVDERTEPTGEKGKYNHPHWASHPDWNSSTAVYNKHKPEQNAFGDWAAIGVGGQYYLFGDYDPANGHHRVGWFTSEDLNSTFRRVGEIGHGHPDPDIGFAEGQFYLITQMGSTFVSPGPWVEKVEARVGVDSTGDGKIDDWTEWNEVRETYDYVDGFAKQISSNPASVDLRDLPACHGFRFEFKTSRTTDRALPVMDAVTVKK